MGNSSSRGSRPLDEVIAHVLDEDYVQSHYASLGIPPLGRGPDPSDGAGLERNHVDLERSISNLSLCLHQTDKDLVLPVKKALTLVLAAGQNLSARPSLAEASVASAPTPAVPDPGIDPRLLQPLVLTTLKLQPSLCGRLLEHPIVASVLPPRQPIMDEPQGSEATAVPLCVPHRTRDLALKQRCGDLARVCTQRTTALDAPVQLRALTHHALLSGSLQEVLLTILTLMQLEQSQASKGDAPVPDFDGSIGVRSILSELETLSFMKLPDFIQESLDEGDPLSPEQAEAVQTVVVIMGGSMSADVCRKALEMAGWNMDQAMGLLFDSTDRIQAAVAEEGATRQAKRDQRESQRAERDAAIVRIRTTNRTRELRNQASLFPNVRSLCDEIAASSGDAAIDALYASPAPSSAPSSPAMQCSQSVVALFGHMDRLMVELDCDLRLPEAPAQKLVDASLLSFDCMNAILAQFTGLLTQLKAEHDGAHGRSSQDMVASTQRSQQQRNGVQSRAEVPAYIVMVTLQLLIRNLQAYRPVLQQHLVPMFEPLFDQQMDVMSRLCESLLELIRLRDTSTLLLSSLASASTTKPSSATPSEEDVFPHLATLALTAWSLAFPSAYASHTSRASLVQTLLANTVSHPNHWMNLVCPIVLRDLQQPHLAVGFCTTDQDTGWPVLFSMLQSWEVEAIGAVAAEQALEPRAASVLHLLQRVQCHLVYHVLHRPRGGNARAGGGAAAAAAAMPPPMSQACSQLVDWTAAVTAHACALLAVAIPLATQQKGNAEEASDVWTRLRASTVGTLFGPLVTVLSLLPNPVSLVMAKRISSDCLSAVASMSSVSDAVLPPWLHTLRNNTCYFSGKLLASLILAKQPASIDAPAPPSASEEAPEVVALLPASDSVVPLLRCGRGPPSDEAHNHFLTTLVQGESGPGLQFYQWILPLARDVLGSKQGGEPAQRMMRTLLAALLHHHGAVQAALDALHARRATPTLAAPAWCASLMGIVTQAKLTAFRCKRGDERDSSTPLSLEQVCVRFESRAMALLGYRSVRSETSLGPCDTLVDVPLHPHHHHHRRNDDDASDPSDSPLAAHGVTGPIVCFVTQSPHVAHHEDGEVRLAHTAQRADDLASLRTQGWSLLRDLVTSTQHSPSALVHSLKYVAYARCPEHPRHHLDDLCLAACSLLSHTHDAFLKLATTLLQSLEASQSVDALSSLCTVWRGHVVAHDVPWLLELGLVPRLGDQVARILRSRFDGSHDDGKPASTASVAALQATAFQAWRLASCQLASAAHQLTPACLMVATGGSAPVSDSAAAAAAVPSPTSYLTARGPPVPVQSLGGAEARAHMVGQALAAVWTSTRRVSSACLAQLGTTDRAEVMARACNAVADTLPPGGTLIVPQPRSFTRNVTGLAAAVPGPCTAACTMAAWVWMSSVDLAATRGNHAIMWQGVSGRYRGVVVNKHHRLQFYVDTEKRQEAVASSVPLPLDQWVHVGCVCEGNRLRVFVNGRLDTERSTQHAARCPQPEDAPVYVGFRPKAPVSQFAHGFQGRLSHVYFSHTACDVDAMAAMVAAGPPPLPSAVSNSGLFDVLAHVAALLVLPTACTAIRAVPALCQALFHASTWAHASMPTRWLLLRSWRRLLAVLPPAKVNPWLRDAVAAADGSVLLQPSLLSHVVCLVQQWMPPMESGSPPLLQTLDCARADVDEAHRWATLCCTEAVHLLRFAFACPMWRSCASVAVQDCLSDAAGCHARVWLGLSVCGGLVRQIHVGSQVVLLSTSTAAATTSLSSATGLVVSLHEQQQQAASSVPPEPSTAYARVLMQPQRTNVTRGWSAAGTRCPVVNLRLREDDAAPSSELSRGSVFSVACAPVVPASYVVHNMEPEALAALVSTITYLLCTAVREPGQQREQQPQQSHANHTNDPMSVVDSGDPVPAQEPVAMDMCPRDQEGSPDHDGGSALQPALQRVQLAELVTAASQCAATAVLPLLPEAATRALVSLALQSDAPRPGSVPDLARATLPAAVEGVARLRERVRTGVARGHHCLPLHVPPTASSDVPSRASIRGKLERFLRKKQSVSVSRDDDEDEHGGGGIATTASASPPPPPPPPAQGPPKPQGDAVVAQLVAIVPHLEPDVARRALRHCEGDLQRAVGHILQQRAQERLDNVRAGVRELGLPEHWVQQATTELRSEDAEDALAQPTTWIRLAQAEPDRLESWTGDAVYEDRHFLNQRRATAVPRAGRSGARDRMRRDWDLFRRHGGVPGGARLLASSEEHGRGAPFGYGTGASHAPPITNYVPPSMRDSPAAAPRYSLRESGVGLVPTSAGGGGGGGAYGNSDATASTNAPQRNRRRSRLRDVLATATRSGGRGIGADLGDGTRSSPPSLARLEALFGLADASASRDADASDAYHGPNLLAMEAAMAMLEADADVEGLEAEWASALGLDGSYDDDDDDDDEEEEDDDVEGEVYDDEDDIPDLVDSIDSSSSDELSVSDVVSTMLDDDDHAGDGRAAPRTTAFDAGTAATTSSSSSASSSSSSSSMTSSASVTSSPVPSAAVDSLPMPHRMLSAYLHGVRTATHQLDGGLDHGVVSAGLDGHRDTAAVSEPWQPSPQSYQRPQQQSQSAAAAAAGATHGPVSVAERQQAWMDFSALVQRVEDMEARATRLWARRALWSLWNVHSSGPLQASPTLLQAAIMSPPQLLRWILLSLGRCRAQKVWVSPTAVADDAPAAAAAIGTTVSRLASVAPLPSPRLPLDGSGPALASSPSVSHASVFTDSPVDTALWRLVAAHVAHNSAEASALVQTIVDEVVRHLCLLASPAYEAAGPMGTPGSDADALRKPSARFVLWALHWLVVVCPDAASVVSCSPGTMGAQLWQRLGTALAVALRSANMATKELVSLALLGLMQRLQELDSQPARQCLACLLRPLPLSRLDGALRLRMEAERRSGEKHTHTFFLSAFFELVLALRYHGVRYVADSSHAHVPLAAHEEPPSQAKVAKREGRAEKPSDAHWVAPLPWAPGPLALATSLRIVWEPLATSDADTSSAGGSKRLRYEVQMRLLDVLPSTEGESTPSSGGDVRAMLRASSGLRRFGRRRREPSQRASSGDGSTGGSRSSSGGDDTASTEGTHRYICEAGDWYTVERNAGATGITVTGLRPGTAYGVRLRVRRGSKGEGPWSPEAVAVTRHASTFLLRDDEAGRGEGLAAWVTEPGSGDTDGRDSARGALAPAASVACSGGNAWRCVLGDIVYRTGTHYWEVCVDQAEYGNVYVGVAQPQGCSLNSPSGWGYVSHRATNDDRPYGEHFASGNVIGVLLCCEEGTLTFFKDGKNLGVAFSGLPPAVSPIFGLKAGGTRLSLMPTVVPGLVLPHSVVAQQALQAGHVLLTLSHQYAAQRTQVRDTEPLHAFPPTFLRQAYAAYVRWMSGRWRWARTRIGSWVLLDTKVRKAASAWSHLRHGHSLHSPSGHHVRVMGVAGGLLWLSPLQGEHAGTVWPVSSTAFQRDRQAYARVTAASASASSPSAATPSPHSGQDDNMDEGTHRMPRLTWPEWRSYVLGAAADPQQDEALVRAWSHVSRVMNEHPMNVPPLRVWAVWRQQQQPQQWQQEQQHAHDAHAHSVGKQGKVDTGNEDDDGMARAAFVARLSVLRLLNAWLPNALPLADLSGRSQPWCHTMQPTACFSQALQAHRGLVVLGVKSETLLDVVRRTTTYTRLPEDEYTDPPSIARVSLRRGPAIRARTAGCLDTSGVTMFRQLHTALHRSVAHDDWEKARVADWCSLRQSYVGMLDAGQRRTFKVKFVNEGVTDNGGPYRETFATAVAELQSDALPLFVRSANQVGRLGDRQDAWVVNPSCEDACAFHFVGQLIGMALRCDIALDLHLTPIFWQRLVGIQCGDVVNASQEQQLFSMLASVDAALCLQLRAMLSFARQPDATEEGWRAHFPDTTWTIASSDGNHVVVLGHDGRPTQHEHHGAAPEVRLAEVPTYVRSVLAFKARREGRRQMRWLLTGLASVIPLAQLRTHTWHEAELLVCGAPGIDLSVLRTNTVYDGVSPDAVQVRWMWQALESFDEAQRAAFLQFVWARSRLPAFASDLPMPFRVQAAPTATTRIPDAYLPTAHTCFFSIAIPEYTSYQVLREKLLLAIEHCVDMDGDFLMNSRDMQ